MMTLLEVTGAGRIRRRNADNDPFNDLFSTFPKWNKLMAQEWTRNIVFFSSNLYSLAP